MSPYRQLPKPKKAPPVRLSGPATAIFWAAGLSLGVVFGSACTSSQVRTVTPPTIDLAGCIISHVVACATASPPTPWAQCTVQTATACGTDAASVVSVWTYHRNAEMREADAGVSYP